MMTIMTNDEAVSLEGKDITVELTAPNGIKSVIHPTIEGNVVSFTYLGINQKYLGKYQATVWESYGKAGQNVVDFDDIFELVPKTSMEEGCHGC